MKFNKVALLLAALVLGGGGYYYYTTQNNDPSLENIAFGNGRIEAVQVDISSKFAGRVKTISALEGDLVRAGQLVAEMDTRQLDAQLLRAQAEVASAESLVAAAEAAIVQAEARLLLADHTLERTTQLIAEGHSTKQQHDIHISNQKVAEANLAAAKATLIFRQRGVDAVKAAVAEIETSLDDAKLIAPVIGRILYRLAEPGEVIAGGGKVLTMIDLSEVYLEFFLPSTQAHRVAIGSEARIKLDVAGAIIPAKVTFVSPVSQFTPKKVETASERDKLMFRVKVRLPQELVQKYIELVKTGIRGVAYVRLEGEGEPTPWPPFLDILIPDPIATQ